MKRTVRLTESELINLIERAIKLNENILPPKDPNNPNAKYTIADFYINPGIRLVKDIYTDSNKHYEFLSPDTGISGTKVSIEDAKTNVKEFCKSLNTTGNTPILTPKVKPNLSDYVSYPPVKYICNGNVLRLIQLSPYNLKLIKDKTGIDYLSEVPYLFKKGTL